MSDGRLKAAVLVSGSGSNLNALIQAVESGQLPLHIVRVISNRSDAGGLVYARDANIPVSVLPHKQYANRDEHDRAIADVLENDQPELIVLAGYMRILSGDFARLFKNRMINLHPSLLPLYKGLDTYNRAIAAGDQFTGASIHVVTPDLDDGPVISQVRIPIEAGDDAQTLAAKLGPLEHKLLVATVREFCQGQIKIERLKIEHPKMMADSSEPESHEISQVTFSGVALKRPLQLQADGSLKNQSDQ